MTKETASDVRGRVETILGEVYDAMNAYKKERDRARGPLEPKLTRPDFDLATGKIRGMAEVLDVFAGLGFAIGKDEK